jgi:hypothetical protein
LWLIPAAKGNSFMIESYQLQREDCYPADSMFIAAAATGILAQPFSFFIIE